MSKTKTGGGFSSLVASLSIAIALGIGFLIYYFILGDPSHFVNGDVNEHPIDGNTLGTVYKGGIIVPFLMAVNLIVVIFSIERFISISKTKGRGNINNFVENIKSLMDANDLEGAIEECDKQKGSLANVIRAGLEKYESVKNDSTLDKEQKSEVLKAEIEEAISLELPMMSKNLVVISTCVSVGTLIGLIGTVLGMIKSFQAMGEGTPDTTKLSVGISEALINTFLGIFASTLATVMYNFFNTKIDQMTHAMDEAGFAIVQNFNANN
ncbi:MotA/TolQ/ExbB proton channel family protein [Fluviicola taffensis]|uniref:Outer membrane transport energization protein ExbB n=1 Tax=Fluviicola taffensis (strain DSM 16823 / NCIMB 13979 / RW262) TaxID=755732 RepID=F2IAG7_FLUTR|nr:MotA/TolQ/ExbB proton channel family protein [Fluviicola taffensis]AEA43103.1 outer membrane transport energization protein ExbB [Fluviicola taffensis DSM 16823]